jgi:hypothetical protein
MKALLEAEPEDQWLEPAQMVSTPSFSSGVSKDWGEMLAQIRAAAEKKRG